MALLDIAKQHITVDNNFTVGQVQALLTLFENIELGDLADVDTAGATTGDHLVFDGTQWEPETPV